MGNNTSPNTTPVTGYKGSLTDEDVADIRDTVQARIERDRRIKDLEVTYRVLGDAIRDHFANPGEFTSPAVEAHWSSIMRLQEDFLKELTELKVKLEASTAPAAGTQPEDEGSNPTASEEPDSNPLAVVAAHIPGRVVRLWVKPGDVVEVNQRLLAIQAMMMENELNAPCSGTVTSVFVSLDDHVVDGDELIYIRPDQPNTAVHKDVS